MYGNISRKNSSDTIKAAGGKKKLEMRQRRPLMMVGKLDKISSRVNRVPITQSIKKFPFSSPDRRNINLESSTGIMSKEKAGQTIK